ncbi:putative sporulation protein YtxC [Romboutsia sp.]|uniref:putative sporulation protein YtxC n=1 Tax=Romboutsia sp. TaxID=1965302 RepID=UPI003F39EA68
MTKKDIHLSLLHKDKTCAINLLNNERISKKMISNDDLLEIVISSEGKENINDEEIAQEITSLIVTIMKEQLLKEYIIKEYSENYKDEQGYIYKGSIELFNQKEAFIKKSVYIKVYNYILNNDYINIEGFVKFRMKELGKYISDVVDVALEEYLIKKDQDEFISVLKYFIEIQEEKLDLLKVHIKEDNSFILYDKNNNKIDNIDDEEIINMVIQENLNYEDFLISTLLTLCPKKIEILDDLNNNCSMEIIDTIKSIFGDRVSSTYSS